MAIALGTMPEEEHGPGLAPLARVHYNFTIDHTVKAHFLYCPANERAGWTVIRRYGTLRGDRVVQGLPPTRFYTVWLSRFSHCDPPHGLSHATPVQPARTISAQRRAAAARTQSDNGQAERVCQLWRVCKAVWTGKVLTTEQAQLLKLIREKTAVFRVGLRARWGWAERRSGSRLHSRLCCHR